MKQDKQLEDKLMELLEGQLTQAVFKDDSKVEEMGEVEESEAVGKEDVGTTGGTQSLAMEVNKEEEEVVVVVEVKQGEMRKWAPLSPLKTLRKRVCMAMGTQLSVGSQVQGRSVESSQAGSGNVGSTRRPCEQCLKYQIECVVASGGAPCENCCVKHYGCSLMLVREVVGGRGGPSGSQ